MAVSSQTFSLGIPEHVQTLLFKASVHVNQPLTVHITVLSVGAWQFIWKAHEVTRQVEFKHYLYSNCMFEAHNDNQLLFLLEK